MTRALVVAALAALAASSGWTDARMLSDTARALGPELAVNSSGQALATWDSETGPDCAQSPASLTCIHTVEVAWRDGFDQTWDWPVALARPGVGATPRLALNDAGRAAVIWVHDIGRDRVVQATYRTGPVDVFPNPSDLSAAVLEVRNHHVALDAAGYVYVTQDFVTIRAARAAAPAVAAAPKVAVATVPAALPGHRQACPICDGRPRTLTQPSCRRPRTLTQPSCRLTGGRHQPPGGAADR